MECPFPEFVNCIEEVRELMNSIMSDSCSSSHAKQSNIVYRSKVEPTIQLSDNSRTIEEIYAKQDLADGKCSCCVCNYTGK